MLKAALVLLFLCLISNAYAQKYDLIATDKGESIACTIDSVADAAIYFRMKFNNSWVHTSINRDEVVEYKFDAIDRKTIIFRPGTTYIDLAYDAQDAYLAKAHALRRSGKIMTISGPSIMGATVITIIVFGDHWGLGAVAVGLVGGSVGLATMVAGIVMNETGKSRIERMTAQMNTTLNGNTFDLRPCLHYDPIARNYLPGVMLRIRF